uniref:Uncharacterized protein LOC114346188 n=1 Tax=Diabrotica virgifera virgifera TaxID=50390 RepID=A0A6P7GTD7_DIAVI
MSTGGGGGIPDINILPDVEVIATHLSEEVTNLVDSDAQYMGNKLRSTSRSPVFRNNPVASCDMVTVKETPSTSILNEEILSPRSLIMDTEKTNTSVTPQSKKKSAVYRLMEIRINNALLERKQMTELREARMLVEKAILEKQLLSSKTVH